MSQDPVSQDLMSQDLNEQFAPATQSTASPEILTQQLPPAPEPAETRFLKSILFGPHGLRVGWSVVLFFVLSLICMGVLGLIVGLLLHGSMQGKPGEMSPLTSVIQEAVQFLGLFGAALICALIEKRRVLDYNLTGPTRVRHFFVGLVGGFAALSALVAVLHAGGWLQFGSATLSGATIWSYGALWGLAFLLTGLSEEGMTRCYMLYTLTRGVNYWWALGTVSAFSLLAFINHGGSGGGGVYLMAALGVVPCLLLQLRHSESAGFWQAAWLTSTFFGYVHTFNKGETWIGIFSAAAIGFIFCVSVRLTGSAWWAIGFHAAWDWAQTYFYGTADSGFQPKGHFLSTSPSGAVLWSGGTDGPEGSVLVIPTVLLVLVVMIAVYGRRKMPPAFEPGHDTNRLSV
jgi:membrane protease YdiL (CAAX protease family)